MLRCSSLILGLLLLGVTSVQAQGATPIVWAQFIHTVRDVGPVDVYVDDARVLDDFAFETATPFMPFPIGPHRIELVAGQDDDNTRPLWTHHEVFFQEHNYAFIAIGDTSTLDVLVQDDALREAATDDVEFFVVHNIAEAPVLDIRLLDPRVPNQLEDLIVNNFVWGQMTAYRRLPPRSHDFQIMNDDNTVEFERFRFDLSAFGGKTLILVRTGRRFDEGTYTLQGYDVEGKVLTEIPVHTVTPTPVPDAFVLDGNYPNPFNGSTTIVFDLPEPAHVYLDVIDLLGRTVLSSPARYWEAGNGHTIPVEAATLASGHYLYRLVAQTATGLLVHTGEMVRAR